MYTLLSPREGESAGPSSVYTKAVSTALELVARSDNGKLDTEKDTTAATSFSDEQHPPSVTDAGFLT